MRAGYVEVWPGYVGIRIVATGSLSVVKRAMESEARILCGGQAGGAVA